MFKKLKKIRKIIPKKAIYEGERIPWWGGIAYEDFANDVSIIYPWGIHYVIGFGQWLWLWHFSIRGIRSKWLERLIESKKNIAYLKGFKDAMAKTEEVRTKIIIERCHAYARLQTIRREREN